MVAVDLERGVSRLYRFMLAVIVALAFAHIWTRWSGWRLSSNTAQEMLSIFDLEVEASIGTFVAASIILLGSAAAAAAAALSWRSARRLACGWLAISLCLAFLAVDEAVAIHDRLAAPFQDALQTGGALLIGWVVPYAVLAIAALAVIVPLLHRLDRPTKRRLAMAGTLYVFAALGLEMIESVLLQEAGGAGASFVQARARMDRQGDSLLWDLLVTVEEVMEMVAGALGARAILLHLASKIDGTVLRIEHLDRKRSAS